jgi:hypothetical protein
MEPWQAACDRRVRCSARCWRGCDDRARASVLDPCSARRRRAGLRACATRRTRALPASRSSQRARLGRALDRLIVRQVRRPTRPITAVDVEDVSRAKERLCRMRETRWPGHNQVRLQERPAVCGLTRSPLGRSRPRCSIDSPALLRTKPASLRHPFDRMPAIRVNRGPCPTRLTEYLRFVDDVAVLLRKHHPQFVLPAQERDEGGVAQLSADFSVRAGLAFPSGAVDPHIKVPKPLYGLIDQTAPFFVVAHVPENELGFYTERAQLNGLFAMTGDDDARTCVRQMRCPMTLRAPGIKTTRVLWFFPRPTCHGHD